MEQTVQETMAPTGALPAVLETCVVRISEGLKGLAQQGDWEAIKSVLRVIDAHTRAHELRALGQPARAHLWLVGVGRKQKKQEKMQTPPPVSPSAA
ncbi:MAG: hypothetical protein HY267_01995 [Deltaproteobacteria bacterium]|nr:hypothetical protein [Deltaproteobacteria bacterium]